MIFPLQQDILGDPNVWIAYSAATVHSGLIVGKKTLHVYSTL
jgi:hypothetical protein